jgi:hypothetical protein
LFILLVLKTEAENKNGSTERSSSCSYWTHSKVLSLVTKQWKCNQSHIVLLKLFWQLEKYTEFQLRGFCDMFLVHQHTSTGNILMELILESKEEIP